MNESKTKKCSKCKEIKLLEKFKQRKTSKGVCVGYCKECVNKAEVDRSNKRKENRNITWFPRKTPKSCTKCKKVKLIKEFHSDNKNKDGYKSKCIQCCKEYSEENKERTSIRVKRFRLKNRDRISQQYKNWYKKNPEYHQKWREKRKADPKRYKKYIKQENANQMKHYTKNKNNSNYKIMRLCRGRILAALRGNYKYTSSVGLLGCSIEFLKKYLQTTAIKNKYLDFDINKYDTKKYHIDHIIPCSTFDLDNPKQQKKCFHYTNMQILTAKSNLHKGNNHENNLYNKIS